MVSFNCPFHAVLKNFHSVDFRFYLPIMQLESECPRRRIMSAGPFTYYWPFHSLIDRLSLTSIPLTTNWQTNRWGDEIHIEYPLTDRTSAWPTDWEFRLIILISLFIHVYNGRISTPIYDIESNIKIRLYSVIECIKLYLLPAVPCTCNSWLATGYVPPAVCCPRQCVNQHNTYYQWQKLHFQGCFVEFENILPVV